MAVKENNWYYWGKCKNCDHKETFIAGDVEDTAYNRYYELMITNYYPTFITFCECCSKTTVYELICLDNDVDIDDGK